MSTAVEYEMRVAAVRERIAGMVAEVGLALVDGMHGEIVRVWGRDVDAKRARKLKRRGEDVRFHRYTPSGRARYRWMPMLKFKVAA